LPEETFMPRISFALLCLLALLVALTARPAAGETILFEGARIIPGDSSPAIEDGALLVQDNAVWRVGRKGEIAPPDGAKRIDVTGKTIMPALVSTHVHPGFQRGLSYSAQNFTRETVIDDLDRALYFGISTVNSLGVETGEVLYGIRADQKAGRLGGAQLLLAGRGIGAPNAGPGAAAYANIAYEITTEEQALDAVHESTPCTSLRAGTWTASRSGSTTAAGARRACRSRCRAPSSTRATASGSQCPPTSTITRTRSNSPPPASTTSPTWCATR
jgi:imidazolonepropionase-like amidohydrolase